MERLGVLDDEGARSCSLGCLLAAVEEEEEDDDVEEVEEAGDVGE